MSQQVIPKLWRCHKVLNELEHCTHVNTQREKSAEHIPCSDRSVGLSPDLGVADEEIEEVVVGGCKRYLACH